jgi:hypothetical protein
LTKPTSELSHRDNSLCHTICRPATATVLVRSRTGHALLEACARGPLVSFSSRQSSWAPSLVARSLSCQSHLHKLPFSDHESHKMLQNTQPPWQVLGQSRTVHFLREASTRRHLVVSIRKGGSCVGACERQSFRAPNNSGGVPLELSIAATWKCKC